MDMRCWVTLNYLVKYSWHDCDIWSINIKNVRPLLVWKYYLRGPCCIKYSTYPGTHRSMRFCKATCSFKRLACPTLCHATAKFEWPCLGETDNDSHCMVYLLVKNTDILNRLELWFSCCFMSSLIREVSCQQHILHNCTKDVILLGSDDTLCGKGGHVPHQEMFAPLSANFSNFVSEPQQVGQNMKSRWQLLTAKIYLIVLWMRANPSIKPQVF